MSSPAIRSSCPLTSSEGVPLRQVAGSELANRFSSHVGITLSDKLRRRYFHNDFTEFESASSGLRWFSPAVVADQDFYAFLARECDWYYAPESWDQRLALEFLSNQENPNFAEIGCGPGYFLEAARKQGLNGFGVDINSEALNQAREKNLVVFHPDDDSLPENVDCLCLFQVLEHLPAPLETLRQYIFRMNPNHVIISVPCFESALGYTSDPLCWPPHHVTFWSRKSLETLGDRIGFRLSEINYDPINYRTFIKMWRRESSLESPLGTFRKTKRRDPVSRFLDWLVSTSAGSPRGFFHRFFRVINYRWGDEGGLISPPPFARVRWLWFRLLGRDWANRRHSVIAFFSRT